MKRLILSIIPVIVSFQVIFAQPNSNLELKKPKKFENQRLASEKTGEKKFTAPRRFIQNTVTHYNYFYNANTRLSEIVARAKAGFRDDYTQLLPFYNYDLKMTSAYKTDLDSIIYKSTAGILLHDLRNSYIDNLYLLIGQAFYYRNELDSAYLTFQYVNYAFSPKEDDGWDKVIGSNSNEGGNVFSVSTKEKQNLAHRALTRPPSRNESFIWQIRTYIARNLPTEASGLIETLKNDPLFPERLRPYLHEVQALWFYNQQMYDSAAIHLEQALVNAETKQEQARWEYLIAQLYERCGKHDLSKTYYEKVTRHTIDPLLEVYSILNSLRQGGSGNEKDVQDALEALLKMGRKDKYFQYRDVIYYTAADIELEHQNPDAATALLLKSVQYSMSNPDQKSRSYLALGDISFNRKQYVAAKEYYDSVNMIIIPPASQAKFTSIKSALDRIALHALVIERQDSLQRIAALPENERTAFLKVLARQLRKKAGLKDRELQAGSGSAIDLAGNNKGPADLFGSTAKGEWYFSNANLRTKGQAEFRSKWGDRANSDNWRRSAAAAAQFAINNMNNIPIIGSSPPKAADLSYEGLLASLPLTEELKKISRDSTEHALFGLGKAYQDGLEEYPSAIGAYERLLSTYPASVHAEEAWFNLYYCYSKTGKQATMRQIRETLASKFAGGDFNARLREAEGTISADSLRSKEATAAYNDVYDLFIEGKFAEALDKKKIADSTYGKNHWTPQLLYIEAVYHIKQREDSTAKTVLNAIITRYAGQPLAEKSKRLLDVLNRRQEIETYLTQLEIQRPAEDSAAVVITTPPVNTVVPPPAKDSSIAMQPLPGKDTVAIQYVPEKTLPSAMVKAPETVTRKSASPGITGMPSLDTSRLIKKPVTVPNSYTRNPEQAHLVILVMDKVDPVYVTEARNAFNRYNKEAFGGRTIESVNFSLTDDLKLLLFQPFSNAGAAFEYADNVKKMAAKNIIPWLKADKYTILMISEQNLELLKTRKDMSTYRKFLTEAYPDLGF